MKPFVFKSGNPNQPPWVVGVKLSGLVQGQDFSDIHLPSPNRFYTWEAARDCAIQTYIGWEASRILAQVEFV
jgi:hypothetical protein